MLKLRNKNMAFILFLMLLLGSVFSNIGNIYSFADEPSWSVTEEGPADPSFEGHTVFKIAQENKIGTFTSGDGRLTVTISQGQGDLKLSWVSDIPVYYVFVKGNKSGNGKGNLYTCTSGATKGDDFTVPYDEENTKINHINFYYKTQSPEPELSFTKSVNPTTVAPGDTVTYTFNVNGTNITDDIEITDDQLKDAEGNQFKVVVKSTESLPYTTSAAFTIPDDYTGEQFVNTATAALVGKDLSVTSSAIVNIREQGTSTGSITIEKVITNVGDIPVGDNPVFTFEIVGLDNTGTITKTITGTGIITVSDLEVGSYTITEVDIPEGYAPDDFVDEDYSLDAVIEEAGGTDNVTFYNKYVGVEPKAAITKTVAEYDGDIFDGDENFVKQLTLNKLNQTVIFKIVIEVNDEWINKEKRLYISDLYGKEGAVRDNAESDLFVIDGEDIKNAVDEGYIYLSKGGIPYLYPSSNSMTLYLVDTLESYGTYLNTVTIFEDAMIPQFQLMGLYEPTKIAEDYAKVTVSEDRPHYRDDYNRVYYKANFPGDTDTSGSVPVDSTKYKDGKTVTVLGNTGDLKADGYKFISWNTKADGSGTDYTEGDTFVIRNDVTLYAQWESETPPEDPVIEPDTPVIPADSELDDVPKTGDNTPLVPITLLGLISAAAIILLRRRLI